MINRRGLVVLLVVVIGWAFIARARAADLQLPYSCDTIRYVVSVYGEKAALNWARSNRWTRGQIATAKRRCLR